jgi:hypothetical protein
MLTTLLRICAEKMQTLESSEATSYVINFKQARHLRTDRMT